MPGRQLLSFHRGLQNLDRTRNRMEEIHVRGDLLKTDIETVYEALFLRAITGFEAYLEQVFIAILLGKTTHPPTRAKALLKTSSKTDLMRILTRGNDYMDWLPYNKTELRAQTYLKGGRPFSELNNGDNSMLADMTRIRNAIAHKSEHANKQFKLKVISELPLLKSERRPAGFLRSQFRASPRQLRFEVYVGELGQIAAKLD